VKNRDDAMENPGRLDKDKVQKLEKEIEAAKQEIDALRKSIDRLSKLDLKAAKSA
jgi:prefoldin subunit 5